MALADNRRRKSQRGTATIETALVLITFLGVIFTCVQYCIVFLGLNGATYGSRVALRYAVQHGNSATNPCTASDLQAIIAPYLWGVPNGGSTVTVTWTPDNSPGSTVSIKVILQYTSFIRLGGMPSPTVGTSASGTILQ